MKPTKIAIGNDTRHHDQAVMAVSFKFAMIKTKRATELAVAVMKQIPTVLRESPFVHGYVSGDLPHPDLVRMKCHPGQLDLATFQIDKE